MKKYLPLIEKNVHWIALGLGALFLLYMVYANILTPRADVPINGETIRPGQVEAYIRDKTVTDLEGRIKDDPRQVPRELSDKPKFVTVFPDPQPVDNIVVTALPVLTMAIPDKAVLNPSANANNNQPGVQANLQVTALPQVEEVSNLRAEAGRASVNLSPPPPVDPNNPNAMPVVATEGADIDYASVAFDFPMTDLSAEFRKTKIPPAFTTSFLEVQLIRQEKNDAGEWGAETVVEKLKNTEQPAAPDPKNRAAVNGYISWAENYQDKVIQPKFYDVVKGDPWIMPGDKTALEAAAAAAAGAGGFAPKPATDTIRQGFDPANPPPDMTNAEKRAKYQFDMDRKRKEQAEKNRNRPQPSGPPGGRGGRGGPGGGGDMPGGGGGGMPGGFGNFPDSAPAPLPSARPSGVSVPVPSGIKNYQVPNPGAAGAEGMPYPPRYPYPQPGDGEFGPGMGMPGMGVPGMAPSGPVPCPTGPFDPRVLNLAVAGWAHDGTVQPGKIYRYKVRYAMKNPIYGAKGLANPPALADTYKVESKDSAWTDEVLIPQRAYYYVAQANADAGKATFDVFTFANGQWNKEAFDVKPGDMVGTDKDGVGYATGYTVVDVRSEKSGNDQVVILADASGNLSRKSKRTDSNDATKAKLTAEMAAGIAPAAPTPAAPGGPGVPGMPGMGGMPGFPDDRFPGGGPR